MTLGQTPVSASTGEVTYGIWYDNWYPTREVVFVSGYIPLTSIANPMKSLYRPLQQCTLMAENSWIWHIMKWIKWLHIRWRQLMHPVLKTFVIFTLFHDTCWYNCACYHASKRWRSGAGGWHSISWKTIIDWCMLYHEVQGCWFPCCARNQGVGRYDFGLVFHEYLGFNAIRFFDLCKYHFRRTH